MLRPRPGPDIAAMHEEERRTRCALCRGGVEKLDRFCAGKGAAFQRQRHCGTAMPRATAGRAEIVSNQRFTCGNAERSTLCHSYRATQGNVAMSAIEYSSARKSLWARRRLSTAYSRRVSFV